MDGTLLDPRGSLPRACRSVLQTLVNAGVRILLATGRMTANVRPYAEALEMPLSLITYNGAVILEGERGVWLPVATHGLPAEAGEAIFALCRAQEVFLNVYASGKVYGFHPRGDFAWSRHYEANSGATYAVKTTCLGDLPRRGIEKLLVMADPPARDRLHEEWAPRLSGLCDLTKSNPEYLEFIAKGVSKGSALGIWLQKAGIDRTELLAFGDAENDLEMLRLAGLGIGMANASPGLRAAYGRFSKWSCGEAGVARELCDLYALDFDSLPPD